MRDIKRKIFSIGCWIICLVLPLIARASEPVTIEDPLDLGSNPVPKLVGRFVTAALGMSGLLALIAFIYGGILFLLSGTSPKFVEKGKEIMKWAVIGLFVIFSSYAAISFFLKNILQVPAGAGAPSGSAFYQNIDRSVV